MVHPKLSRIRFDKQIFRMLITNAVLRSLNNCYKPHNAKPYAESDNVYISTSISTSNVAVIHEILIQVGFGSGVEADYGSTEDAIERDIMCYFLSCPSGNDQRISHVHDPSLSWISIAVADNGVVGNSKYLGRSVEQDVICEKMVKNGLGGRYEAFEAPRGVAFGNILRFSIPYYNVEAVREGDRLPSHKLWLAPSFNSYSGFERATNRYEFLRRLYEQRKVQVSDGDDESEPAQPRRAILVHPEVETGKLHASAFEMEGWLCTIVTSLSDFLTNSSLPDTDLIVVCSSVFPVEQQVHELMTEEELNYRGFYGAAVCLQDAGALLEKEANTFYICVDPPVLRSTVLEISELSDKRPLEYIIGANRAL